MLKLLLSCFIVLTATACSAEQPAETRNKSRDSTVITPSQDLVRADKPPAGTTSSPQASTAKVLTLEGLGELRIGQPIPVGSKWAERGAQISDTCRTVSNPEYPGTYAIIENDIVRRITASRGSNVRLIENIGVGSTEKEVGDWFGGFRKKSHKYQAAPAKYLTAPNATSGDPALRFEIGGDGKVALMHVGTMPVLAYVEGCA